MKAIACQLLVSFLLYTTVFTYAAPPKRMPVEQEATSSRRPGHDFQWSVTSFRPNVAIKGHSFKREPSEEYLHRIRNDPSAAKERFHTLLHEIHPGSKDRLMEELKEAHKKGRLNDAEFKIHANNLKVKVKGRKMVYKGKAVRIGDTVHHPIEMHASKVATDFVEDKMANIHLIKMSKVRHDQLHAMMLLKASPEHSQAGVTSGDTVRKHTITYNQRPMAKSMAEVGPSSNQEHQVGPSTSFAQHDNRGKAPITSQAPLSSLPQERANWHVTSLKYDQNQQDYRSQTEPVEQYREELKKQAAGRFIHGFTHTPHPLFHNPASREKVLAAVLHGFHQKGYSPAEIDLIRHNANHLTDSVDFIQRGGVVNFPATAHHSASFHHPAGMNPLDAAFPRGNIKVGHVKVIALPQNQKPGTNHRLQFEPHRKLPTERKDQTGESSKAVEKQAGKEAASSST
jgi:hypothetical protein